MLYLRLLAIFGTFASLIGLIVTIRFQQANVVLQGILIGICLCLLLAAIVLEVLYYLRNRPLVLSLNEESEINRYMYQWIERGGKVAVFSHDFSWVSNERMKELFHRKAQRGELTLCIPHRNPSNKEKVDLIEDLEKEGAQICTYYDELGFILRSRFTIINIDRMDTRIAVGWRENDKHKIEEYTASNQPVFPIISDLADLIIRFNNWKKQHPQLNGRSKLHPVSMKTQAEVSREWSAIVEIRANQLENNDDLSYSHILAPAVMTLAKNSNLNRVIDIGCGSGFLAKQLAAISEIVVGIDMNSHSIELAKKRYGSIVNLEFINSTVENQARENKEMFSLAVANMTFATVIDLKSVIRAISQILCDKGSLIITLPHPFFWALYRNYLYENWFEYRREIILEGPLFDDKPLLSTTQIHRPLEFYISELIEAGFVVNKIMEPNAPEEAKLRYEHRIRWEYPRFLVLFCSKL